MKVKKSLAFRLRSDSRFYYMDIKLFLAGLCDSVSIGMVISLVFICAFDNNARLKHTNKTNLYLTGVKKLHINSRHIDFPKTKGIIELLNRFNILVPKIHYTGNRKIFQQ